MTLKYNDDTKSVNTYFHCGPLRARARARVCVCIHTYVYLHANSVWLQTRRADETEKNQLRTRSERLTQRYITRQRHNVNNSAATACTETHDSNNELYCSVKYLKCLHPYADVR